MKASDYIIGYLQKQGVTRAYGYIGGMIVHLVNSICDHANFSMVNMICEQGAAFAAEASARYSGKTALALATSGPGATNLITGIGSCFFDSVPVLFISGQVNTYEFKDELPIRQRGFQETDIVEIVKPITKYAKIIKDAKDLRYELEKSFFLTQHGRKGPVLLDIPMNIQRAELEFENERSFFDSDEFKTYQKAGGEFDEKLFSKALELIKAAKRPIILLGGGCNNDPSREIINQILAKSKIPVVYSLMGHGAVSSKYEYNLGLIGSYGNRYANLAVANSDLLLVIGSRLDSRQTGTNVKSFAREATIIKVDIDKNETDHSKIRSDFVFNCDAKYFLNLLNNQDYQMDIKDWHDRLKSYKLKYPSYKSLSGKFMPENLFISRLSSYLKDGDIVCSDVGQNQMWVAQSLDVLKDIRIFTSGGMGSMGFALPSAIGAAVASGARSVVISGDGGFQMNIGELEVIKRRKLPVKIIIMNNACLGMVRQFQELYFGGRCLGTVEDYSAVDFVKVANAYGIKAQSVSIDEDYQEQLAQFMSDDEAGLFNINLGMKTEVEPKLIVNMPIEDMYPHVERKELEENMIIALFEEK